jgi:hypothetical protein
LAHPPVAVLVLVRATALGCASPFADLPRSDAVRLTDFVSIPTPLWHICQLLFWFLSVQLHSDLQPLIQLCAALISVWPSEFLNFPTQCRSFGQMLL